MNLYRSLSTPLLLSFVLLAGASRGFGQTPGQTPGQTSGQTSGASPASEPASDPFARGDAVLANITRIDFLSKVLPVNLSKEQMRALLPALEKARAIEWSVRKLDAIELAKLEPEVTKSVDDGMTKTIVPTRDLLNKIIKVTRALNIRRQIAFGEMTDIVYDACVKSLDSGQRKVMENTLRPDLVDPSVKLDKMSGADKQKFFIRYILLNNVAYETLLKLSK